MGEKVNIEMIDRCFTYNGLCHYHLNMDVSPV